MSQKLSQRIFCWWLLVRFSEDALVLRLFERRFGGFWLSFEYLSWSRFLVLGLFLPSLFGYFSAWVPIRIILCGF